MGQGYGQWVEGKHRCAFVFCTSDFHFSPFSSFFFSCLFFFLYWPLRNHCHVEVSVVIEGQEQVCMCDSSTVSCRQWGGGYSDVLRATVLNTLRDHHKICLHIPCMAYTIATSTWMCISSNAQALHLLFGLPVHYVQDSFICGHSTVKNL